MDVDERHFADSLSFVKQKYGGDPRTETDFRRVLDNKDVDAVTIAAPDHWHALMTIWACQAGKDVYVEKPISHNIVEGRRMIDAARRYNRIVEVGTQRRSSGLIASNTATVLTLAAMFFEKLLRYSRWWAEHHLATGRRASLSDLTIRPVARFFTMLIVRSGWRDGAHGAVIALLGAMSVGAKYAQLWALQRTGGQR